MRYYEIFELVKEQDPVTGEVCSGDEVLLGKRLTANAAIRYAVKMAAKMYEVMVREYDQRLELTAHWYMKRDENGGVKINKVL